MDKETLISELRAIIEAYLKNKGLDPVDIIYRHEGRDLFLRILVDRPEGGISLAECAAVNIDLSRIFDEKDVIPQKYILEVSSPGLGRPLKTKNDFFRCVGKKVKFFLNEKIKEKIELDGKIERIENESLFVEIEDEIVEIPLSKVNKAKLILDKM